MKQLGMLEKIKVQVVLTYYVLTHRPFFKYYRLIISSNPVVSAILLEPLGEKLVPSRRCNVPTIAGKLVEMKPSVYKDCAREPLLCHKRCKKRL